MKVEFFQNKSIIICYLRMMSQNPERVPFWVANKMHTVVMHELMFNINKLYCKQVCEMLKSCHKKETFLMMVNSL